jgi:hypothetical protein
MLAANGHRRNIDCIADEQGLGKWKHSGSRQRSACVSPVHLVERDDAIRESLGKVKSAPCHTTAKGNDEISVRLPPGSCLKQTGHITERALDQTTKSIGPVGAGHLHLGEHQSVSPNRPIARFNWSFLRTQQSFWIEQGCSTVLKCLSQTCHPCRLYALQALMHGVKREWDRSRLPRQTKQHHVREPLIMKAVSANTSDIGRHNMRLATHLQ